MKYRSLFFGCLCATVIIYSCDIIDNPVMDFGSYDYETYGPPPEFTALQTAVQKVLLEDFTGHDCGNCPAAHIIANDILEADEEHVTVVAVHAGSLAEPFGSSYPNDWRTEEGEYYLLTQIGADLLPTGRVNRLGGASVTASPTAWPAVADDALNASPVVDLQVAASYEEANGEMNVHVSTEWFGNASGDMKLIIMITEDSIVAPQLNYDADPTYIPAYLHRHMLRGTISGATGLTVATNPNADSDTVSSYTFEWNDEWNAEHVEIVALITNGDNGEVLNVTKKKLIE